MKIFKYLEIPYNINEKWCINMMKFAGKDRSVETKYKKISEDLKKDTNSFVETIPSIVEGSTTIKNNLEERIKGKEAEIGKHRDHLSDLMKEAGISNLGDIEDKKTEYKKKLELYEAQNKKLEATKQKLQKDLDEKHKEEVEKEKQKQDPNITEAQKNELDKELKNLKKEISSLESKIKKTQSKIDAKLKEVEDADKHLKLFDEIETANKVMKATEEEYKRLAEFAKDPATALLSMVYTGIDLGKKELITELTNIKTEEEAVKFLKNNDSFNDAVNLSNSFHEFLEDMNKAQKLAEKQGKKMTAEFATTYWERIKGRIGPHIGRAESSDISQKRVSTINSIIDEISSNPEVLQDVGRAYLLVSTLGKLNRNARERAEGGKLKNEVEPVLKTVKEYISNYDFNTQKIKDEIGAKVSSGSSKENRQSAPTTTEGTYYGWKSKAAMNEWLNDLDHYLKVNPKQKELVESEYKKYEEEIMSRKLTMDHALQLYTAVISAKAEVLKSERNEETHFNHATKHLVNMFNKESDPKKRKELADMIYRVDLAYTASISRWETSELTSNDELINMFSKTNRYLMSLYPDANAQPDYEELREELKKLAERHARSMYNLLKGKTLQEPTETSGMGSLLRNPTTL